MTIENIAMPRRLRTRLAAAAALALLAALPFGASFAQSYPDKPIKMIVAAPPGGGMDGVGRAISDQLTTALKQPVVVENRPGGNGIIGTQAVARAAADGYTLLLIASFHTINPATIKSIPYDAVKDFAPVAKLGNSPLLFVSSAASGVRTVADYNAWVARNKDGAQFAVSSMETRLGAEAVLQLTNSKGIIVNYKGTGPAVSDVVGGHVPFFVTSITPALPFKDTGKLNFIGVAATKRNPYLPDVPTLAEQGLNADVDVWYGVLAPAGTPTAIVERLNREITKIAALPDYQAKLKALSIQPSTMTPAEFDTFIKAEVARYDALVKAAKIEPE
jgi:tripartite-type tricarboxylate transporter receptor subunit TctC